MSSTKKYLSTKSEMDMADTCRVCLCGQRRLHAISNTLFQEMWEKLTNAKFNTNDGKSLLVCYLCCAQLRRSHQLMKRALEADKLLTDVVNSSSEQSQNALLLLASQTFGFDYKYSIEHLYPLEYKHFVRNAVEDIKKENEEDNEEWRVINFKEEEGETNQEDNLDNADVESGTPLDDKTLWKEILEREVHVTVEGMGIGASARKRTLNAVHQHDAKRVKLDETTKDRSPLTNTDLETFPKRNCITLHESFSKKSSVDSNVKNSKNKQDLKSVANCNQGNSISPKVNTLPKHKIQVNNVVAQNSETSTSKVVCNNSGNETFKPCLSKSVDVVALNSHLHKATREEPYKYDLCDSQRGHFENHIKYKNTKEKNFSCHLCQYKCVTKSGLIRHLRKHTGEKPYKCDLCDYRCSQIGHLERHIKHKHTKEKNFSCHVCQYKCVTKDKLNIHLCKHTGEKAYKCDICDYRCSQRGNLENHIKHKHTNEKNFLCHICQYKCVTKSVLIRHLRKHTGEKPYKCDICDFICSRRDHLVRHINCKHTKEKNFSCHVCQYICVTKSMLNIHLRNHTGEKQYKCDLCDYRCLQRSNLDSHIKYKHTKEKNFSCHVCQYKGVTKSGLIRHLRQHTGEKPYKCDLCDYRCSQGGHLERHIKHKHTKEKNFSCHVCLYKCVTKDKLNVHFRKHTGEKPYKCDMCDYICSFKSNLNQHILSKHTK